MLSEAQPEIIHNEFNNFPETTNTPTHSTTQEVDTNWKIYPLTKHLVRLSQ